MKLVRLLRNAFKQIVQVGIRLTHFRQAGSHSDSHIQENLPPFVLSKTDDIDTSRQLPWPRPCARLSTTLINVLWAWVAQSVKWPEYGLASRIPVVGTYPYLLQQRPDRLCCQPAKAYRGSISWVKTAGTWVELHSHFPIRLREVLLRYWPHTA